MADKPFPTPASLVQQIQNLVWRLATEMRALYSTTGTKITKADADDLYLGKNDKAASAGSADTAASATKLATARTIRTNLASTSTASFNGTANVTPGVTGTLPIAHGGTGATTAAAARTALGIVTLSNDGSIQKTSQNYNSLLDAGHYHVDQTGATNGPGFAAKVEVLRKGVYITQVAYPADTNGTAPVYRYSTDTGSSWSDWTTFVTGYLPLTGGTMTGALKVPTPASASNDTTATTTAWVTSNFAKKTDLNGQLANYVLTSTANSTYAKKSETVNHTAQSLTDAQKTQARTNIGAAADTAVVKVTAQTLTDAQKTQARTNIGVNTSTEVVLALIASQATWYRRPSLPTSAKTSITIPAGTQVNISGNGYVLTTAKTLQVSTVGSASARAGKDVYIYACQPVSGTEPNFVLSLNSTVPTGYTASNSRKIGGFHCLCVSAGTIANCEASGYSQGDIIPPSIWDLLHRAQSENEGMSFVEELNLWVDIYLPSWSGSKLQSAYGGEIVDGYSAMPMHGERFVEYSGYVKKHLLSRDQFMVVADSGNQMTNIQDSVDPGTTGGHKDTAGRRIITNDFIEDCTGVLWQWTSDVYSKANLATSAATYNYNCVSRSDQTATSEGNHWWDGCNWQTDGRSTANINVDGAMYVKGDSYGVLARARVGARWVDGSHCGSRAVDVDSLSSSRDASLSARLGSSPRVVSL